MKNYWGKFVSSFTAAVKVSLHSHFSKSHRTTALSAIGMSLHVPRITLPIEGISTLLETSTASPFPAKDDSD